MKNHKTSLLRVEYLFLSLILFMPIFSHCQYISYSSPHPFFKAQISTWIFSKHVPEGMVLPTQLLWYLSFIL